MANTVAGIEAKAWVKAESSFDTAAAIAATDAFHYNEMTVGDERAKEELSAHVGTSSAQGFVLGKYSRQFSVAFDVRPSASAGTAPDAGLFLKSCLGTETISGGTSVTYEPTDSQNVTTLQVVRSLGANATEWLNGLAIQTMTINAPANEKVTIQCDGMFATKGWLFGGATVNGAHTAPDTTVQLASGTSYLVGVNALVKFGSEDNGGSGYRVTAVDYATDIITISPTLAGNLAGSEVVAPVLPSQTLAGTSIGGVEHTLTTSASVGFQSATININGGNMPIDNQATDDSIAGWYRARRSITGEIVFNTQLENLGIVGGQGEGRLWNCDFILGPNTATKRMKVEMPSVRFDVSQIDVPDAELSTFSAAFTAYESSAAGDEIDVILD